MTGNKMNKAFTVVELLVVMAIIGILSLVIIPSYKNAKEQLALERSAVQLAQYIAKAREMAISTYECGAPCGGTIPWGYGLYIDKADPYKYYIYADTVAARGKYGAGDPIIETIEIESLVKVYKLVIPSNGYSIDFEPPDPLVYIKNQAGEDKTSVEMVLSLKSDESKQKTIKINKVGLITID